MTGKETLLFAAFAVSSFHGQVPQSAQPKQDSAVATAAPLAFETVSVKPAPPGSFPFVSSFIRNKTAPVYGLQTMTVPVQMTIAYAYHMQMSEAKATFDKQPSWVKHRIYTQTFRVESEATHDQVREMLRTMLADRFGLQIHEFTKEGAVNRLVMNKPGVLGPKIKPHPEGATCSTQEDAAVGKAPDAPTPPVANCGFSYYYLPGNVLHVGITDTTIADAGRALTSIGVGGIETRPLLDGTGLPGKYDLTLEFRPNSGNPLVNPVADDDGVPTLIQAVAQQLGMRVESGTGPVRMVIIDHLSEPTPD